MLSRVLLNFLQILDFLFNLSSLNTWMLTHTHLRGKKKKTATTKEDRAHGKVNWLWNVFHIFMWINFWKDLLLNCLWESLNSNIFLQFFNTDTDVMLQMLINTEFIYVTRVSRWPLQVKPGYFISKSFILLEIGCPELIKRNMFNFLDIYLGSISRPLGIHN